MSKFLGRSSISDVAGEREGKIGAAVVKVIVGGERSVIRSFGGAELVARVAMLVSEESDRR